MSRDVKGGHLSWGAFHLAKVGVVVDWRYIHQRGGVQAHFPSPRLWANEPEHPLRLISPHLDCGHGGPGVVPTGPVERVQGLGRVGMCRGSSCGTEVCLVI